MTHRIYLRVKHKALCTDKYGILHAPKGWEMIIKIRSVGKIPSKASKQTPEKNF
jgi:hypothetical protein